MKLITETVQEIKILTESVDGTKKKALFIEGIFLQGDLKNGNGRVYPSEVLDREVERYIREYVEPRRAFGELGHPDGPTINLDRVSHIVTELRKDGKNWIGKAKITESTPCGKIAKALIDEGAQLAVSSRGVGSLKEKFGASYVQADFQLTTAADIVANPSAPDAFVNGIMEGKEFFWNNGILAERDVESIKKRIRKASSRKLQEAKIAEFQRFMDSLKNANFRNTK